MLKRNFCFATLSVNKVLKKTFCSDDMNEQIRQLEPFLEFIDHDTEIRYDTEIFIYFKNYKNKNR